MAGIGIGILYVGYCAILYGYCQWQGYNITVKQMFDMKKWPPDFGGGGASADFGSYKPTKPNPTYNV